ncbi:MAG: hypothetical protein HUU57_05595 [Bdellovibrio sp.]|nr:hypothetical protein [Bdellovibrio sp.]
MMSLKVFAALAILVSSPTAWALSIDSSLKEVNTSATVSTEFSQLAVEGESISGSGLKLGFDFLLTNHISTEFLLATTLDPNNGFQTSYTALGLYGSYNLLDASRYTRKIQLNGKNIFIERHEAPQKLSVGLGFEQVLLNGSRGVYSASGPGLSITYQRELFGWNTVFAVRKAMLKSNTLDVDFLALNLGVNIPF